MHLHQLFDTPTVSFHDLKKQIRSTDRRQHSPPVHPVEWLLLADPSMQPLVESLWKHGTRSSLCHLHAWFTRGDIDGLTLREDWCWAKFLPWQDDQFCVDWLLRGHCSSTICIMAMASPPMRTYLTQLSTLVDP
jgi:hypothetical protein